MEDGLLEFEGKKYISSKRAAETYGYTKDYIGQLARGKKIDARLVGRSWYVLKSDLEKKSKHKSSRKELGDSVEIHVVHNDQIEKSKNEIDLSTIQEPEISLVSPGANIQLPAHENSKTEQNSGTEIKLQVDTEKDESSPTEKKPTPQKVSEPQTLKKINKEKIERQEDLLANMSVEYEKGSPLYYSEETPLFVEPKKDKKQTSLGKVNYTPMLDIQANKQKDVSKFSGKSRERTKSRGSEIKNSFFEVSDRSHRAIVTAIILFSLISLTWHANRAGIVDNIQTVQATSFHSQ